MNKAAGEVEFKVGSVSYDLKLSIENMIALENEFNRNIVLIYSGYVGNTPPYYVVARVLSVMAGISQKEAVGVISTAGIGDTVIKTIEVINQTISPEGIPKGEA